MSELSEQATSAHTLAGQAGTAGPRAFLVVYADAAGAGAGDRPTRVVELDDGVEVSFGRSRTATIMVDDERVSRLHARVVRQAGRIVVEDLGSRNGTRVNGTHIDGPAVVGSGDVIEVGPAQAVVGVTGAARRPLAIGGTAYFDDRIEAEVDRAARYRRPLALLMVRVEGPGEARDRAVDRIAASLRRMDTLAEYAPDEYAVIAAEVDGPSAAALATRIEDEARAAGALVRTGAAAFPGDGATADELITHARASLRRVRVGASPAAPPVTTVGDAVVADPRSRQLYQLVDRVAATNLTVLILGETGVGKELVAEALHRRSARAAGPLVRLNCASLPDTLLESELFGYERGAFTGADRRKIGYLESAAGGTLFLDEIGEMPAALQAKLLRVLEQRTIVRVGGTAEVEVDVRLVAATHRDLDEEVRAGRFRDDLYFRISTFTLPVPPLRERPDDILPLAERFAAAFAAELGQPTPVLDAAVRRALCTYAWPGNVRELRNAIERAVVMAGVEPDAVIALDHLPERTHPGSSAALTAPTGRDVGDVREHIAEVERAAIVAALEATGGNQTRAAARLGLSRRGLIYKLEKHGLKPPPGGRR